MDRPKLEVADVFRRYGKAYREKRGASMSPAQRRVMRAIEVCRTAALGGHLERCDQCDHERNCYNSCADRHCPKCQSLARARWIEDRQSELLDVPYFHVVFTVPPRDMPSNRRFPRTDVTLRTSAASLERTRFTSYNSRPEPKFKLSRPAQVLFRTWPFRRMGTIFILPGSKPLKDLTDSFECPYSAGSRSW